MRNRTTWAIASVLTLATGATPHASSAQMATPWTTQPPIYFNTALQLNMIHSVRRSQQAAQAGGSASVARAAPRTGAGPVPPAVPAAGSLRVGSDPAVSSRVRETYLRGLAEHSGKAAAQEVDRRLGDIRSTFARMVVPYGLRADDFADVTAAYTIIMWMAANRRIDLPTKAQVQGVQRQIHAIMDGRSDDPAQRQTLAEMMMYQTCMAAMVREQAAAQNRPELIEAMAAELDHRSDQAAGLRALTLTDGGLARR